MSNEVRIQELLSRWEECRASGHSMTLEELCVDCPDLLPVVRQRTGESDEGQYTAIVESLQAPPASKHISVQASTQSLGSETETPKPSNKERAASVPGYEILGELGRGGMGVVYKARHQHLGRLVALKVIKTERLDNPKVAQRFLREAKMVAKLSHPNVIKVYDGGEENGVLFLAMEFLEGIDLAKRVREHGPLPVAEACEYIRQTAAGLQHLYENGLVHRDIKPQNLFLTKGPSDRPVVKILDMGLARFDESADEHSEMASLTMEGAVVGTPDYLSPEQAKDSRSVDVRSDIYSLGCTAFFLLTGKPPYAGGSFAEKIAAHMSGEMPNIDDSRPDVPGTLAKIVRKMMSKKPELRFQTPAAVELALDMFMQGKLPEAKDSYNLADPVRKPKAVKERPGKKDKGDSAKAEATPAKVEPVKPAAEPEAEKPATKTTFDTKWVAIIAAASAVSAIVLFFLIQQYTYCFGFILLVVLAVLGWALWWRHR